MFNIVECFAILLIIGAMILIYMRAGKKEMAIAMLPIVFVPFMHIVAWGINLAIKKIGIMTGGGDCPGLNAVIAAAEKSGVIAGVCHQNRFNIAVQELRTALERDRFGKLSHGSIHIRWFRDESYYKQDDWRGKWALDGEGRRRLELAVLRR